MRSVNYGNGAWGLDDYMPAGLARRYARAIEVRKPQLTALAVPNASYQWWVIVEWGPGERREHLYLRTPGECERLLERSVFP